jgi:ribosomal protein S18 acetylase RimI-like enzyme
MPMEFLSTLSVTDREAMWSQCISNGKPWLLVVDFEHEIIGFVAYGKARSATEGDGAGEVWAIYVAPQHWARSNGKALLAAAVEDLRTRGFSNVVLWAIVGNERADHFYKSTGFIKDIASRRKFNIAGAQLEEVRYQLALPPHAAS